MIFIFILYLLLKTFLTKILDLKTNNFKKSNQNSTSNTVKLYFVLNLAE